jgi:hypothetical protein
MAIGRIGDSAGPEATQPSASMTIERSGLNARMRVSNSCTALRVYVYERMPAMHMRGGPDRHATPPLVGGDTLSTPR